MFNHYLIQPRIAMLRKKWNLCPSWWWPEVRWNKQQGRYILRAPKITEQIICVSPRMPASPSNVDKMYLFDIIDPKLKTNHSDIITDCPTNFSFISKVNVLCCPGDEGVCAPPSWVFGTIGAIFKSRLNENSTPRLMEQYSHKSWQYCKYSHCW